MSSHSQPVWMRRAERGSVFWLRVMSWLSLHLGRRLSRPVLWGIAAYFTLAAGPARRASRDYLRRSLGREPRLWHIWRHMWTFASTVHDRVYLLNGRMALFDVRSHGQQEVDALQVGGTSGALLLGAHLGSFEVLRALAQSDSRLRVAMAMYPENARQINAALAAINPEAQVDVIALGQLDSILSVHQRLRQGGMVGVLADRGLASDDYRELPFLGAVARFPVGPFRLAVMLRQPVYFMAGLYEGASRYSVHFEPLTPEPQADGAQAALTIDTLMRRYVGMLERHCLAHPYNWFNFYDFWHTDGQGASA